MTPLSGHPRWHMRIGALVGFVVVLGLMAAPHEALSQSRTRSRAAPVDPKTEEARQAFVQGTAAVKAGQWAEALAQFERASELRSSPIVTFNIGYCQRALGRYILAKQSFVAALEGEANLPKQQADEARTYIDEIDRVLARVSITLKPANARLAIDGRPLKPSDGDPAVLLAGVEPAGEGKTPPSPRFEVIIDPGVHLLHASRPGHADVLLNRTFAPGSRDQVPLELDELPATIHVEADQPRSVVTVDERDVGIAPVEITRPAGRYRIQVFKKGFVTYDSTLELTPGQKANLKARLAEEQTPITRQWWFWGGAAAVVAGGLTATYFLTRPDAQPPPYEGGSLGWVAQPR